MADSSVSFLLDKLTLLLQAEVNLQRGVREDVQHIKYELERHRGILRVADALEDKDPELKAWVKRVRDVAHDMEDAIDEFSLRLVDQHGQGNSSSFHVNFFIRHRIASNIQNIKSRVDIISQGRPNIAGIGSGSSQRLRLDSQGDALLLEEADLVGIDKPKRQLSDLLFNEEAVLLKDLVQQLHNVIGKPSPEAVGQMKSDQLKEEIVNLKSKDQNFATIAKDQDIIWPDKVRRLSIINTLNNVQQNRTTFQLRSLLMFASSDSLEHFSIRALCSSGYKLLRVLDLQDAPLEVFPAEIVSLYLLKYLSLKNTKVKSIPGSIKKLQQLETLDLKHTYVTVLPVEIVELQRLRHLLVYRYEIESYAYLHSRHGFMVAAPIGLMQSLQKLCFIEANQALMIELGKLTQLRRLGIRKMRKQDGAALCSSIEKMINLRSLSITAIEDDEIIDIHNIFRPPQYLQQLYLEFFDMPEELITALRPNGGEDYWRVQHVPAVYISYWRDGGWDVYSLETLGERESDSSSGTAKRSLEICTLWKV
ncbi:hypothetical protein JHK85_000100 [Glycine max]|nr:hypothetical protein JHK85_000100 [Glycine max]